MNTAPLITRILLVLAVTIVLNLTGCRQREQADVESGPSPRAFVTPSGIETVWLPGGKFQMGSESGNADEQPRHEVELSPFLIDKYEVTQEMMAKVELPNPSRWQDDPKKPVERIRWRDAKVYCNERSLAEGLAPCYDESVSGMPCNFEANGYRLPTEAEWEYACRAGTDGDFDFGDADKLSQYAIFSDNGQERTHPVESRKPNAWGIHGMYGNVAEWCQDVYDEGWYAQSPAKDPVGPSPDAVDAKRVLRGGSWKASANMCRAGFRQGQRTGDTDACFYTDYCGFRCVRRLSASELSESTDGES